MRWGNRAGFAAERCVLDVGRWCALTYGVIYGHSYGNGICTAPYVPMSATGVSDTVRLNST